MTAPSWTILVPTIGERRGLFSRLMGVLLPQLDPHEGRVRVLAYWNNGQPALPEIRQRMVEHADTDYVSCVDDDDLVPADFVDAVVEALASRPDYVGFRVQCYTNGVAQGVAWHSLRHGDWFERDGVLYRDISHVNPIRRELALRADFCRARQGQPEDRTWVAQLRGIPRTEVVIDRVLYDYYYSTSTTAGIGSRWRRPSRIKRAGYQRLEVDHPYFAYHPGSRA